MPGQALHKDRTKKGIKKGAKSDPFLSGQKPDFLDTLAQLVPSDQKALKSLTKKQIAKSITLSQLFPLIDLESDLKNQYWKTYRCVRTFTQNGYHFEGRYCNARWCNVCNRIRMAKMINGYAYPLSKLDDPYFVTLTIPNMNMSMLKDDIDQMIKTWRNIRVWTRKNQHRFGYGETKGIRKLECTHNWKTDTYHPHFHVIIEGKEHAEILIREWLKRYPKANRSGQDMRIAKEGSMLELFKYSIKGMTDGKYNALPMDVMYRAMFKKRVHQPFGLEKDLGEDIDGIQRQQIRFKGDDVNQWTWCDNSKDWVNWNGEKLTGYIVDGRLDVMINQLK